MKDEIKEILDRLKDSVTNPIIDVPVMGGVSEPIDNSQCLEPNECKILLDYITNLQEENEHLKFHLNDIVFEDDNVDVELGARLLRKLGYCDFDEERMVYVNKHNNQPFMQEDVKEKAFYIKDDELDDYTKQLEYKIDKARAKLQSMFDNGNEKTILDDLLELDRVLGGK